MTIIPAIGANFRLLRVWLDGNYGLHYDASLPVLGFAFDALDDAPSNVLTPTGEQLRDDLMHGCPREGLATALLLPNGQVISSQGQEFLSVGSYVEAVHARYIRQRIAAGCRRVGLR